MDFQILNEKKEYFEKNKHWLPSHIIPEYTDAFEIEYHYHSTAMDGNSFSLEEVKMVLCDGMTVGEKQLSELYEIINHKNTYAYIKQCLSEGKVLSEEMIKEIHRKLTENIVEEVGYRTQEAFISGARHILPAPNEISSKMNHYYANIEMKKELNAMKYAAWTHAEFIKIFPFSMANGKTARMLLNYQLLSKGFLPISIPIERQEEYFDCLEKYASDSDLSGFTEMISELENEQLDQYNWLIEKILYDNKK